MQTKDDAVNVVRRWYCNMADLLAKDKMAVVMQEHAAGYKFDKIMRFLDSKGVRNHFSTPKEQWKNA